jgi:hypothetical protein
VLNGITFQRTWRIPPPPTGLYLSGRGLLSSDNKRALCPVGDSLDGFRMDAEPVMRKD